MKTTLALVLFAASSALSAACSFPSSDYTPLGEINAVQINQLTASGTASIFLTKPGSTTQHNGAVSGVVTAFNAQGFPTSIKYQFKGPTGSLNMTGTPVLSSLAPLDADSYALRINVAIKSGKLAGKPVTGSFVMRGITNSYTGAEQYWLTSGSVCY